MSQLPRGAWLACAAWLAGVAQAQGRDCGAHLGSAARQVATQGLVLAWAPRPAPIPLDRHFELDVVICGSLAGAAPGVPLSLKVDALMPAHRHGMNYRATTTSTAEGRFRAQGLLFHMPGAWRLVFDVDQGGERLRLTDDITAR